jgi:hypothetical protein
MARLPPRIVVIVMSKRPTRREHEEALRRPQESEEELQEVREELQEIQDKVSEWADHTGRRLDGIIDHADRTQTASKMGRKGGTTERNIPWRTHADPIIVAETANPNVAAVARAE